MKRINKLISLILVISMIFAAFSVVFAEEPTLTINITNLTEPVAEEAPGFECNVNFSGDSADNVHNFRFGYWLELDKSYEFIIELMTDMDDFGDVNYFYNNAIRAIGNPNFSDTNVPITEIDEFLPNKTYIALFEGSFNMVRERTGDTIPMVYASANGKTNNVKCLVGEPVLGYENNEIIKTQDAPSYVVNVLVAYDTTTVEPEPEPEPVEIPKIDIKATVDWVNTAEKNIPNSIVLKLMNGASVVQEQTITKVNAVDSDTWEYTFKEVPEEDEEGNKIAYTLAYAEANTNDLKFFNTAVKDFTIENTFIDPEIKSTVKMTSIVDRETNNVKYKITFNSSIKKYSGDAEVVLTTTLPFAIDETKSKLDGGTYDPNTRSIIWVKTIRVDNAYNYSDVKNVDLYATAVLPYAIEAKTVGEIKLTAVADYSESVDTVDTIESTNGNPKTGDVNLTRYSTIGLIGIAAIGVAVVIKRKYSTRKSKVQF